MRTVLMVAEKPSLAEAISKILSKGRAVKHNRISRPCAVYEYDGMFQGQPARFKFTCTTGHVYSLDFTSAYQDWHKTDEETLFFQAKTYRKEASEGAKVVAHLANESKRCTDIVLWLDCDREGENICFEVLSIVQQNISWANTWRAKFSAITPQEIEHAMRNLVKPDENQALAVDARQELDLKVGIAFSRFQTKYFQGKYGNLDASVVSYGPCQTPTLAFTVARHDEIQNFKPEKFWRIYVTVKHGRPVQFDWERNRVFDKKVAELIVAQCQADKAKVVSVMTKRDARSRPGALNTVELLKKASQVLGIGPHSTMSIAERLYMAGYISYPRTESTAYPPSFDLIGPLRDQKNNAYWGDHVKTLLDRGITKPKSGHDAGDHPPITPMKPASEGQLTGDEWRIYDLVTRTFIATLSPDMHFTRTKIVLQLGPEKFSATGRIMDKNEFSWAGVLGMRMDDEALPEMKQGELVEVTNLELYEGETSPPGYLTESELIGMMERNGIGTDASIPTHINNICERGYCQVGGGRTMIPTTLGIILVHGYHKIDSELVLPLVRQNVEREVTKIAEGKARKDLVVDWTLRIFKAKFKYFKNSIERMDQLMEASFSPLSKTGQSISKCGNCLRYLKLIESRPQRLYCQTCEETFGVPQNGKIKLFQGKTCPLDGFELLLFTVQNGKTYHFCPQCYNDPPFENIRGGGKGGKARTMGCNECPHPTCPYSATHNTVTKCPEEKCPGYLNLDLSNPVKWRMVCNHSTCNVIVKLPVSVKKAAVVSGDGCESCNSNLLHVYFHKDKSPMPGEEEYVGCVCCDEFFNESLEEVRGKLANPRRVQKGGKGGKGGKKGRGRKGGLRKRRKGPSDDRMGFDTF